MISPDEMPAMNRAFDLAYRYYEKVGNGFGEFASVLASEAADSDMSDDDFRQIMDRTSDPFVREIAEAFLAISVPARDDVFCDLWTPGVVFPA